MLVQKNSSLFLGFGPRIRCKNCGNENFFHLRQDYTRQYAVIIPIGSFYGAVSKFCPICEIEIEYEAGLTKMKKSQAEKIRDLWEGREMTEVWMRQLNNKERDSIYLMWNKLKAYDLVRYIESRI